MPPRDVPDISCIIHTKRNSKRLRLADEEHSLAPNAGSMNGDRGMRPSASQDLVAQRPPSSPTPATNACTPCATVVAEPSIAPTAISELIAMEREELAPAASMATLVSDTAAAPRSDHGQEISTNVLNYFMTIFRGQPTHQQEAGTFNPCEEGEMENEEGKFSVNPTTALRSATLRSCPVYLIDEGIEPTQQIIAHLLSLRDGSDNDVQEDADIFHAPEMDEEPDYPSEFELEVPELIDIHDLAPPGSSISRPHAQH